ncbi:MAG TPA: helix-turn-helix domain-containing protein [Solirubrobacterales bacterium]|jgi:DNA-binding HxlR family transcriptional regulator|nr:helix-turn-helix domain-containing protein [Solirubrobacterales bacterium]
MRPGGSTLSLLASSLNVHILKALEEDQRSLTDLSQAVGLPPASTMRTYLKSLTEIGVIERRSESGFAASVSYVNTPAGMRLLAVGDVLQRWLGIAPGGPISLGSTAAKSAIKALVDGWDATIVRALAARPLTLTELHRLVPQISYPTLERRLAAMRLVGLVEAKRDNSGRGTPYRATRWLRQATAPLAAAVAWERRHLAEAPPIGRLDVEAGFLLAVPLVRFPARATGTCRLALETGANSALRYAGVQLTLDGGKTASCVTRLEGEPDAWVVGSALEWFRWVNGREEVQIEFGGDTALGRAIADSLRETLVPVALNAS